MALATQCPHCGTMFRVASDQLKLRGGIVRCGACQEIFDGSATLIDLHKPPVPAPAGSVASADPALPPVSASPAIPAAAAPAPQPVPAEAPAPEAAVPAPAPAGAEALPFVFVEAEEVREAVRSADLADAVISDDTPIYTLDLGHTFDPFGILPKPAAPGEDKAAPAIAAAPASSSLDRFAEVDIELAALPSGALPEPPEVDEPPAVQTRSAASLLDLVAFTVPDPDAPPAPFVWPAPVTPARVEAIAPAVAPVVTPAVAPAEAPAVSDTLTDVATPADTVSMEETVPDSVTHAKLDAGADPVADTVPEAAADLDAVPVAEALPDRVADTVTVAPPDTVAHVVIDIAADGAPDVKTDAVMDRASDAVSDAVSDVTPDTLPDTEAVSLAVAGVDVLPLAPADADASEDIVPAQTASLLVPADVEPEPEPAAEPTTAPAPEAVVEEAAPAAEAAPPTMESEPEPEPEPAAEPIATLEAPAVEHVADADAPVVEPVAEAHAPVGEPVAAPASAVNDAIAPQVAPALPAIPSSGADGRIEPGFGLPPDEELVAVPLPDDPSAHDAPALAPVAAAARTADDAAPLPLLRESSIDAGAAPTAPVSIPAPAVNTPAARRAEKAAARRSKLTPTKIEPQPKLRAPEIDEPDFVKRSRQQEQSGRTRKIAMLAGSVVLLVLLLAQSAYTFRNTLAAHFPGLKPTLVAGCALVGCRVELLAQVDNLAIETGELTTLGGGAYAFTTELRNSGTTAQAWPSLELALTDANDKPLVRRVFAPRDYLGTTTPLANGIAPRSEQAVKLHFRVDDLKPSGYHIAVFYP